jgi:hypothetical protein
MHALNNVAASRELQHQTQRFLLVKVVLELDDVLMVHHFQKFCMHRICLGYGHVVFDDNFECHLLARRSRDSLPHGRVITAA